MTSIYETFDKTFARVSASVVLHKGDVVAKIAFKFPADGAGRLTVYVHWIGAEMVKGTASGYGYDKRTAAVANAARKLADVFKAYEAQMVEFKGDPEKTRTAREAFRTALIADTGKRWDDRLTDAGFVVITAV